MPVPKPEDGEDKKTFISRCIRQLSEEDPEKPKDEISAICYTQWDEKSKSAKPLYEEIIERISKVRTAIVEHFGERGKALLDYTLIRIGAFDPKSQQLNLAALKGDFNLPFVKTCPDGSIEIGNLVFADVEFDKIDAVNHKVSGYVNTVACDVYDDIFLTEAYEDSLTENYLEKSNPIYFMHHREIAAGNLDKLTFDESGAYAETTPYENFWGLFENKTLRGFSVGGRIRIWPDVVGRAWVSHKKYALEMPDISYVTRPANMLSYYDGALSHTDKQRVQNFVENKHKIMHQKTRPIGKQDLESPNLTARTGVIGSQNKKKENRNLSEPTDLKEQKLSTQEQIEDLFKQRDAEVEQKLLNNLKQKRAEELKLQEDDRLTTVEKELGILKGIINTKLEELTTKLDAINKSITDNAERVAKLEDAPDFKKSGDAESKRKVVAITSISEGFGMVGA